MVADVACAAGSLPPVTVEPLLEVADSLLGPVELIDDLTFSSKAHVARLRVQGGPTVVAKQPLDPDAFAREVEAFEVLPAPVRPALVVAGRGVWVMEDLGAGPSLADLLLGSNPEAAEAALLVWSETLGRALRPTLRDGSAAAPDDLAGAVEQLGRLAAELDVAVPGGVADDVASIASTLARPGPWLAFCPSDACPDNNRVLDDGSVRLFDFEGAGWRNAALEAAYCRAPFCTCWCVARLPTGMRHRMESVFLAELVPANPSDFADVVALAAVSYTLVTFDWFRRFVMEDLPAGPAGRTPSTGRQYVYSRLITIAAERERLPALADVAGRLAAAIVTRWPDAAAMPLYPAFR